MDRKGRGVRPAPDSEALVGIGLLDDAGTLVFASATARRLLGIRTRALPQKAGKLLGSLDPRARAAIRRALPRRPNRARGPGRPPSRDIEVSLYPIRMREGRAPARWVALFSDRATLARDRERAELYYQAFLRSHTPMELTDRRGILVDVNPAFERVYGYPRAALIGQKPNVVRSPHTDRATVVGIWSAILDPGVGHWSGELINLDRSGHEHPVRLTIDAIRDRSGEITHFMGVATDLSEIRSLHLQAVRAERLASLGELAAGVAHELNTPLANVMLAAESLMRRSTDPRVRKSAEAIVGQVESATRIVRGLLDFSRSRPQDREEIDLVAVVDESVDFVRGKQSGEVRVVQHHPPRPLRVLADRPQLLQVFVNILNNAYDAMAGAGTLTIRSGRGPDVVWVSVADTGPGVPGSLQAKLFEPFFTTKPEGKGTGLGLSICLGIVNSHGGRIRVDSKEGEGATFVVELPPSPGLTAPPVDRPSGFSPRGPRGTRAHPGGRRRRAVP